MRQVDKKALYEGRKVKIVYSPKAADEHHLIIGTWVVYLQRGVLEELSRTKPENLERKLNTIDGSFDFLLKREEITYESIGIAIAQARIVELEEELSEAYRKAF